MNKHIFIFHIHVDLLERTHAVFEPMDKAPLTKKCYNFRFSLVLFLHFSYLLMNVNTEIQLFLLLVIVML